LLKQLRLVNFRTFEDFTVSFADGAYLVGPNNAGKSTILTALRTADVLLRHAYRRKPEISASDAGVSVAGYPVTLREFPALRDSLRHEFGSAESRLDLQWKDGARLVAVWPAEEDEDERDAFFYLQAPGGFPIRTPAQAKAAFPPLGIVPILGPTEHSEKLLADEYVRQSIATRLSSRHFRNQLRLMQDSGELQEFLDWAAPWLGEITFDRLGRHLSDDGMVVEAFFFEAGSRVPKEIVWAGDGIQVWLQLLYHVFRVRSRSTIVLDEPEVYLHPDLQRRLVHLLEHTGRQVVVATHSAEMVAESDGRLTTLVDKSRKRANRPRTDADYEMLSSTLGTAFNLRLAKALRSHVAVFVEGNDMVVLRRFAKTLGLTSVESEAGLTIIPLKGYSNWGQVSPFKWLCEELLPDALDTYVILDRDYRSDEVRSAVMAEFCGDGIHGHVWRRKELESYLLTPAVVARLSKCPVDAIVEWLGEITHEMENDVFGRLLNERLREQVSGTNHAVSVTTAFKPEFDKQWLESSYRLQVCPPKQVVSKLNARLQAGGFKAVSLVGLARAHRRSEIPEEVADLLSLIESRVARA
jgi:AAA domain, putative AbiEii toxin, Type IV TA system